MLAASGYLQRPSPFARVVIWGLRAISQPIGGRQRAVISACMHLCNQCRGVRKAVCRCMYSAHRLQQKYFLSVQAALGVGHGCYALLREVWRAHRR